MYRIIIIFIFLIGISVSASEVDEIRAELDGKLGLNNQGTEFWLSYPDMFSVDIYENFYISLLSETGNVVHLRSAGGSVDSTIILKANESKIIRIFLREYNFFESQRTISKVIESVGIHIQSENPITVHTFNTYAGLKDASLALPVSSLGKEYMLQTYYKGPGVSIVAPYDDTKIKLRLAKSNPDLTIMTEDSSEYKGGDSLVVSLNKGDVWYIFSTDTTGDLTGSMINSNNPINVTYSHYVIDRPRYSNHANEIHTVLYPINTWGKEYFVPSYEEFNITNSVRISTVHDNVELFKDGIYWTTINNTFENQVFESILWSKENKSPQVITSNKPISVLFFSDREIYEGESLFNSFSVNTLTSLEQFTYRAYFSIPNKHSYLYLDTMVNRLVINYRTLNSEVPNDIEISIVDTSKIVKWKNFKEEFGDNYISREINGYNYFSHSFSLPDSCEVYIRAKNTRFGGYYYRIYSRPPGVYPGVIVDHDSYAFPISTNTIDLTTSDTTTPKVTLTQMNNRTHGIVYDFDENASGLAELYMLEEYSHNYNYKLISADRGFLIDEEENSFIPGEPVQLEFELTKKDLKADAFAVLYTTDKAGNDTLVFVNEELFTSVESESEIDQFVSITNDELIFNNPIFNSEINKLSLFDINGSVVKSIVKPQRNRINISELNSGTYFLMIRTTNKFYAKKFSVVR